MPIIHEDVGKSSDFLCPFLVCDFKSRNMHDLVFHAEEKHTTELLHNPNVMLAIKWGEEGSGDMPLLLEYFDALFAIQSYVHEGFIFFLITCIRGNPDDFVTRIKVYSQDTDETQLSWEGKPLETGCKEVSLGSLLAIDRTRAIKHFRYTPLYTPTTGPLEAAPGEYYSNIGVFISPAQAGDAPSSLYGTALMTEMEEGQCADKSISQDADMASPYPPSSWGPIFHVPYTPFNPAVFAAELGIAPTSSSYRAHAAPNRLASRRRYLINNPIWNSPAFPSYRESPLASSASPNQVQVTPRNNAVLNFQDCLTEQEGHTTDDASDLSSPGLSSNSSGSFNRTMIAANQSPLVDTDHPENQDMASITSPEDLQSEPMFSTPTKHTPELQDSPFLQYRNNAESLENMSLSLTPVRYRTPRIFHDPVAAQHRNFQSINLRPSKLGKLW